MNGLSIANLTFGNRQITVAASMLFSCSIANVSNATARVSVVVFLGELPQSALRFICVI